MQPSFSIPVSVYDYGMITYEYDNAEVAAHVLIPVTLFLAFALVASIFLTLQSIALKLFSL